MQTFYQKEFYEKEEFNLNDSQIKTMKRKEIVLVFWA